MKILEACEVEECTFKTMGCNYSHYDDVRMDAIASQITSLTIVYSTVYSDADQSKHQSSASLAFVRGIHRWPVNSPHKGPVTRKMFPFDDVIMIHDLTSAAVFLNSLRPRQNGRHFADDTFNRIFVNENVRISNKFSLKFVPKGPINNIQALVQIMAWRRPGDKPLSEAMMVNLPTHICVSRPQWVNRYWCTSIIHTNKSLK